MGKMNMLESKDDKERAKKRLPSTSTMGLISKCKRLEQALMESEKAYQELADSLPQTVFEIDKTGKITFSNKHGFQVFGYSKEDFAEGLNAFDLLVTGDRERAKENIRKVLAGEKSPGQEYEMLKKDGITFHAIIFSTRIMHDDEPWGIRG
ncbi:PAS domain-containing protein, partial [Chloroflexota bacterium]